MDKFVINGPCKIGGQVKVSGSKNAALPILAATLLFDKKVELKNLPNVKDIETMLNLLRSLNKRIVISKNKKTVKIYNTAKKNTFASYALLKTMRAGILCLGGLVTRYKKAIVSTPGGCNIGLRKIDFHLSALKKMKMKYKIKKGYVYASVNKNLSGSEIRFPRISVGATENILIAACLAKGTTILRNCAIEPEIKFDLTNFLIKAGAQIKWIGKRTVKVKGVKSLKSNSYSIMGDRIECGTYCVAATISGGKLKIKGFNNPSILNTELTLLKKIGAIVKIKSNEIFIKGPKKIKSIQNIKTKEYPGFPTDLQPQFMTLLCKANTGRSLISENIFESRFVTASELRRLGAKISIKNNTAIIESNAKFEGAELMSSDLRGAAALVLAAIVANGRSVINRIYHLDRGYEKFENKLRKVGIDIKRVS